MNHLMYGHGSIEANSLIHNNHQGKQQGARVTSSSSICSWADPYELNKLLENFASSPTSHYSSPPQKYNEQLGQREDIGDLNYIPYNPAASLRRPSIADALYGITEDLSDAPPPPRRTIPSKAQRLMGVGAHEPVYEKSTFFDSDDEDDARVHAPRVTSPRSKSDSRILFRSAPKNGKNRPRSKSPPPSRQQSNLFEDGLFPPASPSMGPEFMSNSKWSVLSSRLRGHNGSSNKSRSKKRLSNSSPHLKNGIDTFGNFYSYPTGDEPISPDDSVRGTPNRTSFSHASPNTSSNMERSPTVPRKNSSDWNEARAASKALDYAVDPASVDLHHGVSIHSIKQQHHHRTTSSTIRKGEDTDLMISPYPLRSLHSASPLSFDVHRRPKIPFQSLDISPSRDASNLSKRSPSSPSSPAVSSPRTPPCASKIPMPTRILQSPPRVPTKNISVPLSASRRESECDIFSEAAEDFAATVPVKNWDVKKKTSTSPRQAKMHMPPRKPPPQSPMPLPPLSSQSNRKPSLQLSEAMQREDAMSRIASSMMVPLRQSSKEEKSVQVSLGKKSSYTLPKVEPFCTQTSAEDFAATLTELKCSTSVEEAKVDLTIGGVLFESFLSQLCNQISTIDDGLVAWLKKQIIDKIPTSQLAKVQSVPLNLMHMKNKFSISSSHSSVSSSGDIEGMAEADTKDEQFFEMSPISRLRWSSVDHVQDERVDPLMKILPLEPLQLTAPLRFDRSHARTPTNVSIELDERNNQDDGQAIDQYGGLEATPDLVGSHTFVFTPRSASEFTPSAPTPGLIPSSSSLKENGDNYIQINLDRNPQSYPFIFHLLKHGILPQYFTLRQFPSLERKRALLALERECAWLGYNTLAEVCLNALGSL